MQKILEVIPEIILTTFPIKLFHGNCFLQKRRSLLKTYVIRTLTKIMQLESFPYACDKQGASVKQLKINIQTLMFLKTS